MVRKKSSIEMKIEGFDELEKNIKALKLDFDQELKKAIRRFGKIVLKENNILNQKLALQRLDAGLYFYNVLLVGDSSATNGKLVITDY